MSWLAAFEAISGYSSSFAFTRPFGCESYLVLPWAVPVISKIPFSFAPAFTFPGPGPVWAEPLTVAFPTTAPAPSGEPLPFSLFDGVHLSVFFADRRIAK